MTDNKVDDKAKKMEEKRKELEAYDREQAEKAEKQAESNVASAKDLCDSDEFKIVVKKAREAKIALAQFDQLSSLIGNIVTLADALPNAIDRAKQKSIQQIQNDQA